MGVCVSLTKDEHFALQRVQPCRVSVGHVERDSWRHSTQSSASRPGMRSRESIGCAPSGSTRKTSGPPSEPLNRSHIAPELRVLAPPRGIQPLCLRVESGTS